MNERGSGLQSPVSFAASGRSDIERVLPLNRWIAPWSGRRFSPDIVTTVDASMRYISLDMLRDVPTLAPPAHHVGKRLPDVLGRELMYQVATAAERAICLERPMEMRYHVTIRGQIVLSRARVTADTAAKVLTFEIARLLTIGLCVVPL